MFNPQRARPVRDPKSFSFLEERPRRDPCTLRSGASSRWAPRSATSRALPALGVALCLWLAGCRTSPPEALASNPFGVVRAETVPVAEEVSRLAEELIPRMRRLLPDLLERPVEVWVQHDIELIRGSPYPEHIAGMADFDKGRVHLRHSDERLQLHLAHELVHVMLGDSWAALPGIVEEGLCDLVASLLTLEVGHEHHVKRLIEASGFFGGFDAVLEISCARHPNGPRLRETHHLRLTFEDTPQMSVATALGMDDREVFEQATANDSVGLYGLGYLVALSVVDRIGFDGLNELSRRALADGIDPVPMTWLLREGGVRPGEAGLVRAVNRFVGPSELAALSDLLAEPLAEAVVEVAREACGADLPFDDFLRAARPSVRLPYHPESIPLGDSDEFLLALEARWSSLLHDV